MSGYLEEYGAGEEKRQNLIRNSILTAIGVIVVVALGLYLFHTYPQIRVTKQFLGLLRDKNYSAAYAAWGCTPATPCKDYVYDKFLEDWGPKSLGSEAPVLRIGDSESCGTGAILTVKVSQDRQEKLWVEKGSNTLSFSPVQVCPGKGPWAIMTHRTIGRLRQIFF